MENLWGYHDLPVENIQPDNPPLVSVDLDTTNPHSTLAFLLLIIATCAGQKCHESKHVQARGRGHFVQLVLGIFVLGKSASLGGSLFFAYEDGCCDGREDERVEETEREDLVLLWDHGSKKGGENREADDAQLRNLKALETGRGFARQGPECERHDVEVVSRFRGLRVRLQVISRVATSWAPLSSFVAGRDC
jgi:hypothetical protein